MVSCISNRVDLNKEGVRFDRANIAVYYQWQDFINKDYILSFNQTNLIAINFFWVDIYSLSNPTKITRIHFPEGKTQMDVFKSFCAYYILENAHLLNTLDSLQERKEANDLISKIFK